MYVLEKLYEMMILEFMYIDLMKFLFEDGSLQLIVGWIGDVKYYFGGIKIIDLYGIMQCIVLVNNLSYLEIVVFVVEGCMRVV